MIFFFNDTATTDIYTLSLHDALPISAGYVDEAGVPRLNVLDLQKLIRSMPKVVIALVARSEEHTSELQSQSNLVCRLLLEKKKKKTNNTHTTTRTITSMPNQVTQQ